MKVQINGEEYTISWRHNNNIGVLNNKNKPIKSSTECYITITGGGVLHGRSILHDADKNYNRKIGKKNSFAQAVSCINDRDTRTQLWDFYWASYKKPIPVLIEVTEEQASLLNTIADIETKNGVRYYTVNRTTFILKSKSDDNSQGDS